MEYITFSDDTTKFKYAIFVKKASANKSNIKAYYINPLNKFGITEEEVVIISISSDTDKFKAQPTKDKLLKVAIGLNKFGIKNILVANSELFKFLTGVTKTTDCYGEFINGNLKGYEKSNILLSVDYNALIYNDSLKFKLEHSVETFGKYCTQTFKLPTDIIHSKYIPTTAREIQLALMDLWNYPELTCDIETESLRFEKARICTIAFAWDQHNGVVFSVDTKEEKTIKLLLYIFFRDYKGKLIFHNALYDCKVIIYQLFMQDSLDIDGLRQGLLTFNNVEDSMLVTYLALNSTQDIDLGLKENSFEFAGNYGIEFKEDKDIHNYPRDEVLTYNLKDALCTWYVYDKHYPTMVKDNQLEVYQTIFQPSIMPMMYMMLIGMPMNMDKVYKAKESLETTIKDITNHLSSRDSIQETVIRLKEKRYIKDFSDRFAKAKVNPKTGSKDRIKIKTLSDISDEEFNPNSDNQKQVLLYEVFKLPVINTTDSGAPSCDAKTLEALLNHTDDNYIKDIISLLQDYAAASIILSTFIHAFIEYAFTRENGSVWLNGNLRLGGTQSGRLSSNSPNLQNLPSNSKYGKLIKECFEAPEGWLFCGADFSSLEDRINAILTKDKNKIKVYKDGYDSHSLRAYAYFKDEMPNIKLANGRRVFQINQNNTTYVLFEGDTIMFDNEIILIEDYYETHC